MENNRYSFSILKNTRRSALNVARLLTEIAASVVPVALSRVDTEDDTCDIWFKADLSETDQEALAGLVAAHEGVPLDSEIASLQVTQAKSSLATFTVMALNVTPGEGKSLLSLYNPTGSGTKLSLLEYYLKNAQTSPVSGTIIDLRLYRFSRANSPAGGAALTAVPHDTDDLPIAAFDCRTGASSVATEESTALDRQMMSTDEWTSGALDLEGNQQSIANFAPARVRRDPQLKAFVANPGEGLHLKSLTRSSVGSLDIIFVFSQS